MLQTAVANESCLDHWTAVRCLAHYGECDSHIVFALIQRLFTSHGQRVQLDAARHLISLSENSVCVSDFTEHTRFVLLLLCMGALLFCY